MQKRTFKHFNVLRQAISMVQSGNIVFETAQGKNGIILFTKGQFSDDEKTRQGLLALLTEHILTCELFTTKDSKIGRLTVPPKVLLQTMNLIRWNAEALETLNRVFSKLPPVRIKMAALHTHGYKDGLTYLVMFSQSTQQKDFTISDFLNGPSRTVSLNRKLKAVLLGYLLGLINPVPKEKPALQGQKQSRAQRKKAIMAKKIMRKIRGL